MDQKNKPKKKVITTTKKVTKKKRVLSPTSSKSARANENAAATAESMLFGKQNFLLMGLGLIFIFFGFMLMAGGAMENPDVWDESVIYSFRRITLAPILVLTGLIIEIYAIFKR